MFVVLGASGNTGSPEFRLSASERVQQLLVNPTKAAIGHYQHHVPLLEPRRQILHNRVRIL